jgi:uncharacterized protein YkwD
MPTSRLVALLAALLVALLAGCGAGTHARQGAPTESSGAETPTELVALVNEARASGRDCGTRGWFDPAPPLRSDSLLMGVAQAHSEDQAARGVMSHQGSDGSAPADRVTDAGYTWRAVGENIAWGYPTAVSAMEGWLASAGHCANLMSPAFEELGVGLAGSYWTQVFAAPR